MKILTRFIQLTLIKRTGIIFALLSAIILNLQTTTLLPGVLNGGLNADDILAGLFFGFVSQSSLLLAMSFFLALLFLLTELYTHNEMYIIFNFGVGFGKMALWLMPTVLLVTALVASLTFFLAPLSSDLLDRLYHYQLQRSLETLTLQSSSLFNGKKAISYKDDTLRYIDINEDTSHIISGKHPRISSSNIGIHLHLQDGVRMINENNLLKERGGFKDLDIHLQIQTDRRISLQSVPTAELFKGDNAFLAEFYQRLALLFLVPTSVLLALVFSRRRPRQQSSLRTIFAILTFILYVNLMLLSISAIRSGSGSFTFWTLELGIFSFFLLLLFLPSVRGQKLYAR